MGESDRYSRQVLLPYVGPQGQRRLRKASAAVVGLGALGCVSSDLLARAGVGRLVVVDRDLVELNNLQRQTLYEESDVGTPKAFAAQKRLSRVNSEIDVDAIVKDVNSRRVLTVLGDAEVVVDGTDNLETRYLLNDASVKLGVPFVYGAALGGEGMAGLLNPPDTACFRCLFPTPPPPGSLPTCETVGILNSAASLVGAVQASLTLRYMLTGQSDSHLYVARAWEPGIEMFRVRPRSGCPTCSEGNFEYLEARDRVVTQLCGNNAVSVDPLLSRELSLEGLASRLSRVGMVHRTPYVLLFEAPPYDMTIFPDGRAIIKGTNDARKASSLYDRYIGT